MKKTIFLATVLALAIISCTKTTNNTTVLEPLPAYEVNGIHDISLMAGTGYMNTQSLSLTIQYADSAQQEVSLALSTLPSGLWVDSNWLRNGIPTFNTTLTFYDTTAMGATPGNYPVTITATAANGNKRTYPFNIKVLAEPICTGVLAGSYASCTTSCSSISYTDNINEDATIPNRFWFNNLFNLGVRLYATGNCVTTSFTIPSQVVNGTTYYGSGSYSPSGSGYRLNLDVFSSATGYYCSITMP